MGHRRRARECALQLLYQIDQTGMDSHEAFEQFWSGKDAEESLRAFTETLVRGVSDRRVELDDAIGASAERWRVERMAVVDRNVLRMAVYELLYDEDTPDAVVIDEAIEVSKKFGSEDSGTFINGILDAVCRRIREGRLAPRR